LHGSRFRSGQNPLPGPVGDAPIFRHAARKAIFFDAEKAVLENKKSEV
jgi:hypothetical protein